MAKTYIEQYRYYGQGNSSNLPNTLSYTDLTNENNVFTGKSIIQIGVQGYPGLKFYLNGAKDIFDTGVIIGPTGIYELNVNKESTITNLRFDENSLKPLDENTQNPIISMGGLIIDIMYVEEE